MFAGESKRSSHLDIHALAAGSQTTAGRGVPSMRHVERISGLTVI